MRMDGGASKLCTVLVTSCDAYRDVEAPFLALFRRHWPDCPFELVVNGETGSEPGFDRAILCGRGKSWSAMLVEALAQISTPYVLMLMNDYFLSADVDTALFLRRLDEARQRDALSYRLVPEPPQAVKNTAYSVSCKATIWNREFLRDLAAKTDSAWEFERRGSYLFDGADPRPILVTQEREFPFLDVIHKGYWEPYGVELMRRERLAFDYSKRGRPPLGLRLREWLKGRIFHLAPELVTRCQNFFGNNKGNSSPVPPVPPVSPAPSPLPPASPAVLWVLNGCGLEGTGVTGAPARFQAVSSRFAAKGVGQRVLTTSGGRRLIATLGSKLPTSLLPASLFLKREPCIPFRLWSYVVTAVASRLHLPREATAGGLSAVVTVSDYFCDVVPALAVKRKTGAKWIAWVHHCETHPSKRPGNRLANEITYRIQRWSFRRIARHADAAWINDSLAGDEIERNLVELGMPRSRIRRMWNGLDYGAIAAAKPAEPAKYDAVMVGVRPNKGLFDIVPVWKRVCELRPGATLVLMGGMSGEAETLSEIRRLGLPIEVFRPEGGFLVAGAYYAKLKEAKILFAPSHEEGWGIVVGEAMAAGLPVVAYDLPAYRKIYAGAYSATACFDRDALAAEVVRTLGDPARADELRERGFATARRYDWNEIAESDLAALKALTVNSL